MIKKYYKSDELYHHGIKGQKWGIRRYQNPDGSLTEEGKKRYAKYTDNKEIAKKVAKNTAKGFATGIGVSALPETLAVIGDIRDANKLFTTSLEDDLPELLSDYKNLLNEGDLANASWYNKAINHKLISGNPASKPYKAVMETLNKTFDEIKKETFKNNPEGISDILWGERQAKDAIKEFKRERLNRFLDSFKDNFHDWVEYSLKSGDRTLGEGWHDINSFLADLVYGDHGLSDAGVFIDIPAIPTGIALGIITGGITAASSIARKRRVNEILEKNK